MGCHALLQGDFPDAGIKPVPLMSPILAGWFFTTSATWEALGYCRVKVIQSRVLFFFFIILGVPTHPNTTLSSSGNSGPKDTCKLKTDKNLSLA